MSSKATEPSPTADVTRVIDPCRTSPGREHSRDAGLQRHRRPVERPERVITELRSGDDEAGGDPVRAAAVPHGRGLHWTTAMVRPTGVAEPR